MRVIYLAHPVRPLPDSTETIRGNLSNAEDWLFRLQRANPDVAIVAPWLQEMQIGVGDDSDPESRRRGLERCAAMAERCDGILLCGPRISSGMLVEARVVCEKARNPEVHRLMHGWQDPRIPAWSYTIMRFPLDAPRWISRASVGASPHGSYRVAAEICEAIEMEKGRP